MASVDSTLSRRKLPWTKLVVAGLVLLVAAAIVLRGVDVRGLANRGMVLIRDAGPWVFFGAMAVLPAFGAPMMAFTIPAGEAFSAQLGMATVIAIALAALLFNLALSYWVARYALRPVLTALIARFGYKVPRVTKENALNVALLVRLTPGPPYPLQCFVLGVAEVPFRLYMVVSFLALLPWVLGAIILGQGLFQGNFKIAATGVGVLVVAVIAVQWVRKKYFRREG
jgi:uncharacterized membrane protein YdjX (TVP38/TMEM64 family)